MIITDQNKILDKKICKMNHNMIYSIWYSPLGKTFNKMLDKNDKEEGLFKKLENIKDKNEEHLQAIKD